MEFDFSKVFSMIPRTHVKKICNQVIMSRKFVEKQVKKTYDLSRMLNYLESKQKEILFKGIIRSQFSYCPLIWMFSSRKSNNLISKVHERSLEVISGDNHSSCNSSKKFASANDTNLQDY